MRKAFYLAYIEIESNAYAKRHYFIRVVEPSLHQRVIDSTHYCPKPFDVQSCSVLSLSNASSEKGVFRKGHWWCTTAADWSIVRWYLASVNFPRCSEAARDRLRAAGKHSRQISSRGSALKITDFSESTTLQARLGPRREPLEYEREIHRVERRYPACAWSPPPRRCYDTAGLRVCFLMPKEKSRRAAARDGRRAKSTTQRVRQCKHRR